VISETMMEDYYSFRFSIRRQNRSFKGYDTSLKNRGQNVSNVIWATELRCKSSYLEFLNSPSIIAYYMIDLSGCSCAQLPPEPNQAFVAAGMFALNLCRFVLYVTNSELFPKMKSGITEMQKVPA
jgi:hypothetical protein